MRLAKLGKGMLSVPQMELNSGLSPSAKQRQNPSTGPPVCVSGFEYIHLPIMLKGNSKCR